MESLKEATNSLHRAAEQTPFSQRMIKGELSKEEYGQYLRVMEEIFTILETCFPKIHEDLNRRNEVQSELESLELDEVPELVQGAKDYVDYLYELDKVQSWAHSYLHYLAIMYGGQMIKKNVPGNGAMYEFGDNKKELMLAIREAQSEYEQEWISEVKEGYKSMIKIFGELDSES